MCGIAGVIGPAWSGDQFDRMFKAIAHRGPDGAGVHRTADLQLGMCRLHLRGEKCAIPIRQHDHTVAFNGQIYGMPDLVSEAAAVQSRQVSIDGMYACVIATHDSSNVRLATDHQFIKPLFYRRTPDGTAFCSELAPLLGLATVNPLNREALAELFAFGWYLTDHTYVENINLVCRNDVEICAGTIRELAKVMPAAVPSAPDAERSLRTAVAASVQRCMDGRGPFGLALSGGLDSSILAWELNAAGVENLVTISIIADGDLGLDSLTRLGLPRGGAWETWTHYTAALTDDDEFLSEFEAATMDFAQPTTMSSLPLCRRLAAAAAEAGVRVLLTGEGVDELFCGYGSYTAFARGKSLFDYYRHPARVALVRELCGVELETKIQNHFADLFRAITDPRSIERELRLTRLLLRSDVCLMGRSIEGRTPFLHHGIPELAMGLSWTSLLQGGGKQVLRRAYRDVLGARAEMPKTRFKVSDRQLQRCLAHGDLLHRVERAVAQWFGITATARSLAALQTEDGFDADVACLLLTSTFLLEKGLVA